MRLEDLSVDRLKATSANQCFWRLVDDVNATLPADRRFSHVGWHIVKHWDFRDAYERLGRGRYPPRRLLRLRVGMALCFAGMVLAVVPLLVR